MVPPIHRVLRELCLTHTDESASVQMIQSQMITNDQYTLK